MADDTMVLSKENLKALLEATFALGALSYLTRESQPETLWTNILADMEEATKKIIDNLETP